MTVAERWMTIESDLSKIPVSHRLLLACFSCERCLSYFDGYCQEFDCADKSICAEVVGLAWNVAAGSDIAYEGTRLLERLNAQADELESHESPLAAAAAESCFACMVLLELLADCHHTEQVARILRLARDMADLTVQEDPSFVPDADLERSILAHPIMQREIQLHEEALRLLIRGKVGIAELRQLASVT
jgi:uncharacterized protein YjaG (DUF416 family)